MIDFMCVFFLILMLIIELSYETTINHQDLLEILSPTPKHIGLEWSNSFLSLPRAELFIRLKTCVEISKRLKLFNSMNYLHDLKEVNTFD